MNASRLDSFQRLSPDLGPLDARPDDIVVSPGLYDDIGDTRYSIKIVVSEVNDSDADIIYDVERIRRVGHAIVKAPDDYKGVLPQRVAEVRHSMGLELGERELERARDLVREIDVELENAVRVALEDGSMFEQIGRSEALRLKIDLGEEKLAKLMRQFPGTTYHGGTRTEDSSWIEGPVNKALNERINNLVITLLKGKYPDRIFHTTQKNKYFLYMEHDGCTLAIELWGLTL